MLRKTAPAFPRSNERGSIEAFARSFSEDKTRSSFHVRMNVAQLKRFGRMIKECVQALFPRSNERGSIEASARHPCRPRPAHVSTFE